MKKIEEAAKECAKAFGYDSNFGTGEHLRLAHNKGVEFAQRWISVEEELPEEAFPDSNFSIEVLVKHRYEEVSDECFHEVAQYCLNTKLFEDSHGNEILNVTHWRPIELK